MIFRNKLGGFGPLKEAPKSGPPGPPYVPAPIGGAPPMPVRLGGAVTQSSPVLFPNWPTTFPDPNRLGRFWYGIANSIAGGPTLANAQAMYPPSQIAKWLALPVKPDCLRFFFQFTDLWPTPGDATLNAAVYAALKYVVQTFLAAGIRIILDPHDDVGTVNTGLHANTSGYNWAWFVSAWTNLMAALQADVALVSSQTVMIELVSEMGDNVAGGTRSMTTYNNFLASVIPSLRISLPDYTFLVCTYPTGTATGYLAGGVELALPADTNLVVDVHDYAPTSFTWQGTGDSGPNGNLYISGMTWGMSQAAAGAYLQTYTAGGLFGTGNAALDAQILNWRANYLTLIPSEGFTDAAIVDNIAPLIAFCQSRQRALMVAEWAATGYDSAALPMPAAQANAYETARSAHFNALGTPHAYWLAQGLTDDPTLQHPGSESFVLSRVLANVARSPGYVRDPFVNSLLAILGPTDLRLWWDPTDITTLFQDSAMTTAVAALADPIGAVKDKSFYSQHGLQAVAGKRPTYFVDAGLGRIKTDGISQFLQTASAAPYGDTMTIWIVYKVLSVTTSTHDYIFDGHISDTLGFIESPSPQQTMYKGVNLQYSGGEFGASGYQAACLVYDSVNGAMYQNNVLRASGGCGATPTQLLTLGAKPDGSRPSSILVAEIGAYAKIPKQAQLNAVQAMLSAKHSL